MNAIKNIRRRKFKRKGTVIIRFLIFHFSADEISALSTVSRDATKEPYASSENRNYLSAILV